MVMSNVTEVVTDEIFKVAHELATGSLDSRDLVYLGQKARTGL